ncbi:glycoside hydrolase family protein [Phycisphaera mikurensis]|uniref:Glycosyl hydrolase family 32 N-terminal domain-containing protein n=1 Tax=Phycisphaera mikurensis (strain NBRC 102666 / KCTC 22515 / FYK2301M01) TaxID=1142394 RepID=I0ICW4_PHYMF|nr:hypothetical protein [Phycisphaera mikurensis]MBB6442232.1 beta-fructofuranosidase [Phycisphaera mikurensis]BAM03102.1 hypothetical protein PSMK_09430 [Phycisphaera mikurensis NBRC 102666]
MLRIPDRLIGDAWFFPGREVVHAYFLTCDASLPRHEHWSIGHAVSGDLVRWNDLGICLRGGGPGSWDHNLATGSVLRHGGRYWMAYTGHTAQRVGVAVSDDLHRWERIGSGPVSGIDTRFYEPVGSGSRRVPHWRDPFLFAWEGWVYAAVCASRNGGPPDRRGTLGLSRSRDLRTWIVLPPPEVEAVGQELECPQVVERGGRWHLLFSSAPSFFPAAHLARHPAVAAGPNLYAMAAPTPLGPFRMLRKNPVLPPGAPYACQLVRWRGRDVLLGTHPEQGGDGGSISDPIAVVADAEGIRPS